MVCWFMSHHDTVLFPNGKIPKNIKKKPIKHKVITGGNKIP